MSHSLNCTEVRFASFLSGGFTTMAKVIIEKSRSEGSLMEQDTIENVS